MIKYDIGVSRRKIKMDETRKVKLLGTGFGTVFAGILFSACYAMYREGQWIPKEKLAANMPIIGTVISEKYDNGLENKKAVVHGGFFTSDTIVESAIGVSHYTLKVKTDDGRILGISVVDGGNVHKESLDALISNGSRISFPIGNINPGLGNHSIESYPEETNFSSTSMQAGTKRADRIRVLH